ncbi:MAG: hypothetical protein WAK82_25890 [Streptosporangiaceae bacterium]
MYSKTMPRAGRLSTRQKRTFGVIAVVVLLLLAGLGIWGAFSSDKYGASGHGCVNVTVASSTGGATLHYCGAQARSFCQQSYQDHDQVSLKARPQCVLAGLGPSADPSAGS